MADTNNPIVAYAGAYDLREDAEKDFQEIKDAHAQRLIGKYDSILTNQDINRF